MVKNARVHSKTLTKLSKGELDAPARRKRSGSTGKSSRIDAQRIDPRVWKTAQDLAEKQWDLLEGRAPKRRSTAKLKSLIEVLGGEGVIIHNNPNWKDNR